MTDQIHRPAHYTTTALEPIDAIEGLELGFHAAQVLKYLCRWRRKNGAQDLRKAQWYLMRLLWTEDARRDGVGFEAWRDFVARETAEFARGEGCP